MISSEMKAFKCSKISEAIAVIEVFLQVYECMLHAEYWNSPMHFILYRHPTSIKQRVSLWLTVSGTVEINIPYDVLLTGYLVFENNLLSVCASTILFQKSDTVALALWASILVISQTFLHMLRFCLSPVLENEFSQVIFNRIECCQILLFTVWFYSKSVYSPSYHIKYKIIFNL